MRTEQESSLVQQLRRTLGRMEAAMGAIHDSLAISDGGGRLLWCNEPFLQLSGQSRILCLGRPIAELLPRSIQGEPLIPVPLNGMMGESSGSRIVEIRQNPLQVLQIQWDPIPDEQPPALVFCLRDISTLISYQELWARNESIQQRSRQIEMLNARLRRSQKHLALKVRECPVTGLPNRRGLMEHLEQTLARGDRHPPTFAVLFCDLNRFKEVNDTHGHDAGDALLIEISRRLREATRQGDLVARLGGDEFVVVSHNLLQSSQALDIAERVQQAVGRAWTIADEVLQPSMSIGIAIADGQAPPISPQELIRQADQAMYVAKATNLRSGQIYDTSLARLQEESSRIQHALRQAIAKRCLALHLQPIVELRSGTVCGHEALVRLPGPEGEALLPDRFINQAERSRLIGPLGQQVLEQALHCLPPSAGPAPPLFIAVNVSPLELAEAGYAERVLQACGRAGVEPGRLQLEITETAVISHPASAARVLQQLRQAGVHILLDDFGTGYSSLSLLSDLPVDGIKIDSSFTAALSQDRNRTAVIQAITQLCHQLGLTVIAEGIETEAQQRQLIELQCDYGQGYLFGRPTPLDGGVGDPR
jgi:diguanylate cyclase (GGDEF)-like protein